MRDAHLSASISALLGGASFFQASFDERSRSSCARQLAQVGLPLAQDKHSAYQRAYGRPAHVDEALVELAGLGCITVLMRADAPQQQDDDERWEQQRATHLLRRQLHAARRRWDAEDCGLQQGAGMQRGLARRVAAPRERTDPALEQSTVSSAALEDQRLALQLAQVVAARSGRWREPAASVDYLRGRRHRCCRPPVPPERPQQGRRDANSRLRAQGACDQGRRTAKPLGH
jgi:hypothetical protein